MPYSLSKHTSFTPLLFNRPMLFGQSYGWLALWIVIMTIMTIASADNQSKPSAIEIESDEVNYSTVKDTIFKGNVLLKVDTLTIAADAVYIGNDKRYIITGNPISISCQHCLNLSLTVSGQIGTRIEFDRRDNQLHIKGKIDINLHRQPDKVKIFANAAVWEQQKGLFTLTDNAHLNFQNNNQTINARADEIAYNPKSKDLTLNRNAIIKHGDNIITGDYVKVNTQTGAIHAQSKKKRVKAVLNDDG